MDTDLRSPQRPRHQPPDGASAAADVERFRPRLFGVAYRMLGDVEDARDVVQDAYLRWHRADHSAVAAPEGWLVTVVTRLAIDRLRRAATERAAYVGPWLPAPIATDERQATDRDAELASDLSMALLVLLVRLAPEVRAAFLLRVVFDTDYAEIAAVLERREPAVRQMVHRARERVRGGRARHAAPPDVHARLLDRFLAALAAGDRDGLLALLAPDATFTSDGGGKVPAARKVLADPERIVHLLLSLERKWGAVTTHRTGRVNGEPAVLTYAGAHLVYVTALATDGTHVTALYRVLNPDKLRWAEPEASGDA